MLIMALVFSGAKPGPGAAQSPALPTATVSRAVVPAGSQVGQSLPSSLPTTVSPAIERFVRQSGRDLPPTLTESREPPAQNLHEDQGGQDVPSALPPSLAPLPGVRGGGAPSTLGPAPFEIQSELKTAPLEPTDLRFPINLATALRLSDARPLIVAAAQASVWVAEAQLTRAKVLWIPSILFGVDYIRHDGGGPDFNKGIMTAPSVNFFYAGPSLWQYVNLTDAIFQPLAARQDLNSRHWDVQSAKNDALLQTADAYFLVHQSRGQYAGALYTVERGQKLLEKITQLSRELVPKVEVERARNLFADLEQQAVAARQEWRVHSANLTQVLRLDPRAVVEPLEHDHVQITLIDPGRPLDDLLPIALTNRPELASRQALVQAAEVRIRQEKMRPLLPLVTLNGFQSAGMLIQGGIFAIGPNSSLNQWRGRDDVSIQLMWQLENFGIGNLARIKARRGNESRAIIDLRRTQDMVAADVNRALARLQSAAARVLQADRALRTGIITFNGHLEGLGETRRFGEVLVLIYRPQEAVYSLQLLKVAFDEYFTTVAEYNRAQFELFHALGYPARELAQIRPPGEAAPVETARPPYLPPVGLGPPSATR
jgi:outer membrane protein TolC